MAGVSKASRRMAFWLSAIDPASERGRAAIVCCVLTEDHPCRSMGKEQS
jgi:hypothetical protein